MNSLDYKFKKSTTRARFNLADRFGKIQATAQIIAKSRGCCLEMTYGGQTTVSSFPNEVFAHIGLVNEAKNSNYRLVPLADTDEDPLDRHTREARGKMHESNPTMSTKSEAFRKNGHQAPIKPNAGPQPVTITAITPEEAAVFGMWKGQGGFPFSTNFNDNQIHRYLRLNTLPYTFHNLSAAVAALNVGHFENPATLNRRGHQLSKPKEYSQVVEKEPKLKFSEAKLRHAKSLLISRGKTQITIPPDDKIIAILSDITKYPTELVEALALEHKRALATSQENLTDLHGRNATPELGPGYY